MSEVTESDYQLSGLQEPLSAKALVNHSLGLKFKDIIDANIYTNCEMTCDLDNFNLCETLKVELNEEVFFEKTWKSTVPRIFV